MKGRRRKTEEDEERLHCGVELVWGISLGDFLDEEKFNPLKYSFLEERGYNIEL